MIVLINLSRSTFLLRVLFVNLLCIILYMWRVCVCVRNWVAIANSPSCVQFYSSPTVPYNVTQMTIPIGRFVLPFMSTNYHHSHPQMFHSLSIHRWYSQCQKSIDMGVFWKSLASETKKLKETFFKNTFLYGDPINFISFLEFSTKRIKRKPYN